MIEISELLERVKAATGASYQLDAEIYATIGGAPHTTTAGSRTIPLVLKGDPKVWPEYTASIDAALALVERVLPEHRLALFTDGQGRGPCCLVMTGSEPVAAQEFAPTLPLAILAATLAALQETQK